MTYELYHHGILGQRWGIRRFQNADGTLTTAGKKRYSGDSVDSNTSEKKAKGRGVTKSRTRIDQMSDDELRARISRLELEKKYSDLAKSTSDVNKGEQTVKKILKTIGADSISSGGKNIGSQLVTYALGNAVNKMAGAEIVNPKKGQKDK